MQTLHTEAPDPIKARAKLLWINTPTTKISDKHFIFALLGTNNHLFISVWPVPFTALQLILISVLDRYYRNSSVCSPLNCLQLTFLLIKKYNSNMHNENHSHWNVFRIWKLLTTHKYQYWPSIYLVLDRYQNLQYLSCMLYPNCYALYICVLKNALLFNLVT